MFCMEIFSELNAKHLTVRIRTVSLYMILLREKGLKPPQMFSL